jgi:DNA-binding transcriptional ArsR family regulator
MFQWVAKMTVENIDEDRKRAEVFDALSHPTRIMLMKALNDEPLGFADLKKKLGIESSGHLQHHISKLGGLIKTDDYGKYTLSDQGKDALHSVDTVESVAEAKQNENEKVRISRKNIILKWMVILLAVVLALSLVVAAFQYNNTLSLQSEVSQLNEVIVDRDTLITQLDTAIHLAESILRLKPPSDSQYLTMYPSQNNQGQITKIFLSNTGASYAYLPAYPFTTPWFNDSASGTFSSRREFELTNNRSIALSFWGWWFNTGETMYGGVTGGGSPALNIGATVRNDYTSADPGVYIGNRTGSYVSSINLGIRFYSWNGSIVEVPKATAIAAPTASSNTAMGGVPFLLASGQTKQVIFYLSPTASDIEAIDHYEIYVSSLLPY